MRLGLKTMNLLTKNFNFYHWQKIQHTATSARGRTWVRGQPTDSVNAHMELWTVLISPLGLAVATGGVLLTGYLIYRYQRLQLSRSRRCGSVQQNSYYFCETFFLSLLFFFLSDWLLPFPYLLPSYAYAPFQVLKRYGIKGPQPKPFYGSYQEIQKLVCNRPLHACHSPFKHLHGLNN